MTALFVVILLDQVLAHPKVASRCAVTGLLAGIICLFIFGTGNFLLPTLIVTVYLSQLLHRLKEERNCRNESKSFYFTDRHCRCCYSPYMETQYTVKCGRQNYFVYDLYSMPSIMRLATNTPLADA